jgi:hypothetical protein
LGSALSPSWSHSYHCRWLVGVSDLCSPTLILWLFSGLLRYMCFSVEDFASVPFNILSTLILDYFCYPCYAPIWCWIDWLERVICLLLLQGVIDFWTIPCWWSIHLTIAKPLNSIRLNYRLFLTHYPFCYLTYTLCDLTTLGLISPNFNFFVIIFYIIYYYDNMIDDESFCKWQHNWYV